MFEMFTGRRPFADSNPFLEGVKRMKRAAAPSAGLIVPGLEPHWEAVIAKCLQIDPKARFQNVTQVLEPGWVPATASESVTRTSPETPVKASPQRSASHASEKFLNWAVTIVVLAAVVALICALWLAYHR